MNRLLANNYIDSLHQQISHSVETIKKRSSAQSEAFSKASEQSASNESSRLNNYSYRLLSSSTAYQLTGQFDNHIGTTYAADSYRYASEVIKEPTVLIDFIFKNNREFDFKV